MPTEQQVLQVVSGDGEFNESGVRQFVSAAHIDTAGVDYQTIAITGPQSSGKSTLMNALVWLQMDIACVLHGRSAMLYASDVSSLDRRICLLVEVLRSDQHGCDPACSLVPPSQRWTLSRGEIRQPGVSGLPNLPRYQSL